MAEHKRVIAGRPAEPAVTLQGRLVMNAADAKAASIFANCFTYAPDVGKVRPIHYHAALNT